MPDLSISANEGYRREEAIGTFNADLEKYEDELWTKKVLMEGLKAISEITGRASIGIGVGIAAAAGLGAISGGLLAPWAAPMAVFAVGAAFQAFDEASPGQMSTCR